MLSTFTPPVYEGSIGPRLEALRAEMQAVGLDVLMVPHADEYQNEWMAAYAERLAWLTHFTGSMGTAVVTMSGVHLFVGGIYHEQAKEETEAEFVTVHYMPKEPVTDFLETCLKEGMSLGYDPSLHVQPEVVAYQAICEKVGAQLVACKENLVDAIWADQPERPKAKIIPHDLVYAGTASAEKRQALAADVRKAGCEAVLIIPTDSIAWALNIRGSDIDVTPLPFSRLILFADASAKLFMDREKVSEGLADHLGPDVCVLPMAEYEAELQRLGEQKAKILLDLTSGPRRSCPADIVSRLEQAGALLVDGPDPCQLPKAIKNEVEIEGARKAHWHDGLILTRFLHWLQQTVADREIDELEAAEKLAAMRRACAEVQDLSFPSISGAGPNGALAHYVPKKSQARQLEQGSLYLVDSGGQYLYGTTDVTRTVAIGTPTAEMKDRFTRVLKGHIALAMAVFPEGTPGARLDAIPRLALWQAGVDYDHGTGHGVGSYLCVHEGPHSISYLGTDVPLQAGMLVTNEPGYYKPGVYGIRIETVMLVKKTEPLPTAEKPMLCFETLTQAPIDLTLVDLSLLTNAEQEWLRAYHDKIISDYAPHLTKEEASWLKQY